MSCPEEGIDFAGIRLPLRLRAGDSFQNTTTFVLAAGLTITGSSFKTYDSSGVELVGITETSQVSGLSVTWGLLDETETLTLAAGEDYSYVAKIILSNGNTYTYYWGPLVILAAGGMGGC